MRERYPEVTVISSAMDLAIARRAVTTDRATDSTSRHRQFGSLAQLCPPTGSGTRVDEVEDGATPGYRAIAPFFGQLGIGMDLRKQTPASLRAIPAGWRSTRGSATVAIRPDVRLDQIDGGFAAHGVVNPDGGAALFAFVWLERSAGRWVRLDGLDPAATYRLEVSGPRPSMRRR